MVGWEAARAHLSHQPGYLDTTLYQAVGPRARFRFVNIAHWASADAFTTAVTSPAFRASASLPYPAHPALYRPLTS